MNNFAVSSDGIATALQDSASALMEAGNNLEQSVALVAAANKVVQDPNSVGSALRTISLRLRGTSVEILEEMGEETEGVIESTSKLQSKIKSLTGVDILTNSGSYKETYTILAEIGQVWEEMSDIDQAALLELMAGKNRANTLAAILGNMDDLKGAYESALNAEGSALKENEAYLDSIQGRIDLFNNSVQTMWMNALNSETIKDFVQLGTTLIEVVDKLGLVKTLIAGIVTYLTTFSKNKIDLASMLGIHNLDKTFLKGFSAFGKQGLTGWIAKLPKKLFAGKQQSQSFFELVMGDPNKLKVPASEFAEAIQDNISDYVYINTNQIDGEIENIQNKLIIARKQLADAKSRDWQYYKTMGSTQPGKDRKSAIDEQINEIDRLERKLAELKHTKDDIVKSAVNDVSTSMSASIDSDIQSAQSMLSVLSEIKNTKLYLGNEQDAAQKIDQMSKAAQNGQVDLARYVSSLNDADVALKAYAASVQDGNYSLAGFQQFITQHNAKLKASGVAAKTAAAGHAILNAALSMGISLFVSTAISYIIEKFNEMGAYAERAAEAIETYNTEQKQLTDQKKTIDELAKAYKKLSSGVNTDTNDNIGLTTEAYEEYLDVCNDIADMFPNLIAGYDSEGRAILSLKGKVDALTDAYENRLKASSASFLTQENKDDVWEAYDSVINQDTNKKWYGTWMPSGTKKEQQELLDFLDKLTDQGLEDLIALSDTIDSYSDDDTDSNGLAKFQSILQQQGYSGEYINNGKLTNFLNDVGLDFEGVAKQIEDGNMTLTEGINTLRSNISVALTNANSDIAAAMGNIKQTVSAKLLWDPDYQELDDNTKTMMNTIVNNLDPDVIAQMGATSIDDLTTKLMSNLKNADSDIVEGIYDIQNDIIKAMSDGDSEAFTKAKTQFENLIPEDWRDSESNNIAINKDADVITQFLQKTAQEIENKSKNYEVQLQFQHDFDDKTNIDNIITGYNGTYKNAIQEAINNLKLGDNATINDVYSKIATILGSNNDDGKLWSSELVDLYDAWIMGETTSWSDEQISAIKAVDAVMKLYGTDIDTVKQKLIDFGYINASIDDVGSFNLSSESTNEFIDKFQETTTSIKDAWNSLNNREMTKSDFIDLVQDMPELMDGVNLADDNWMVKAKENLEELNQTKIDDFISKLQQMKMAMQEDGQDTSVVDSFINYAQYLKTQPLLDEEAKTSPDTISGLKAAYESYLTVFAEGNEIIYDGQKISAEYYESLKEYIDDVEELDDCFDKNNKNIVTNARKLKQLITQQKKETITTTQIARAQSQLEYQDLVQELYNATNAYDATTSASFEQINSLLQQIDTVQDTITQYKLLELSLLGATNAFEEFQRAQEIDSETDYETSTEEIIQALGEGFDSGKVGTHAFNAAIKGLLPENVYGDLADSGDLDAVWKEFTTGNLSKFFTYSEDDGFDITLKNMKNFVAEAQKAGVMTGDSFDEFGVVANTSLKDFAEAMGLSESATFAFLEMLTDYSIDGKSLTSELADVKFDTDIENATNNLNALLEKKVELLKSGDYDPADMQQLNADIETAQATLESANQAAINHANQYTILAALQSGFSGGVEMTRAELDNLAARLVEVTGETYFVGVDDKTLINAKGEVVDIQAMLTTLGTEPTILSVQLAYADMENTLAELDKQKALIESDPAKAKITLNISTDEELQKKKEEIDAQIAAIQTQMQILEVQYEVSPAAEKDTSILEKFETLEKDGVKTTVTVDATKATNDVNEFRENAEKPLETTITVNTQSGTTTVTTDRDTKATVDFKVGTGFYDVLDKISTIKQATSVPIEYKVTVNDEGTAQETSKQINELNSQVINNKEFTVSDNDTIQVEKTDVLDLDATTIANKVFDVSMDGYTNVKSQLDTVLDKLKDIDDMSATATVTVKTVKTEEGADNVNGNFHISGGAFSNGSVGAPRTEEALVGELGPELLVRGNRWTTIGENGAEFTQVKKGDIIFNHKQTEQLLKNGYISSRGKAYASGTAYKGDTTGTNKTYTDHYNFTGTQNTSDAFNKTYSDLSSAAGDLSAAADDFKEVFDWIAVRIEEIDESISLKQAQLENAVGFEEQNKIIDSIISDNKALYNNLIAGANKYYAHAATWFEKIPTEFQEAAKDGSIAITEFKGKVSEEGYNAIQEYRNWVQEGAAATQRAEEAITEIRSLARQAFDNISAEYDSKVSVPEAKNDKIQAAMDLAEEQGKPGSSLWYEAMRDNTNLILERKQKERNDLQTNLDEKVESGEIIKNSPEWYDMIADIMAVDEEIIQLQIDLEGYQNAINELHWENFDENIDRLQDIADETQGLIDLLGEKDLFDENGVWTDEGITTIGLYGQQMENAKLQAKKYANEINDLTKRYEQGLISEGEYTDKLAELKKGQQDAIKEYNNAADAIQDLQKDRVDAIKNGIDKEIEAYEELIKKKKEALSSEKDLHDFRKSISEKNKDIAEIERKLAALAGDNSMAARAERARLEAELAEAKADRDEMYYDRSVENQQEALDKSLENFTDEKEQEKEGWDKWLEDTEGVLGDAFKFVTDNAEVVNETLKGLADEYGLKLSDAIIKPWEDGETTMGSYWDSFTDTGSDAIDSLKDQLQSFKDALSDAREEAKNTIDQQKKQNKDTTSATYQDPSKTDKDGKDGKDGKGSNGGTKEAPKVGSSVTVKKTATNFSAKSGNKKMASFVPGSKYTVYQVSGTGNNAQVLIGKNGAYTGWVKLTDLQGYAKGTTGVKKDQLAWIDELGLEELVMHADGNGRLAYLTKGSSVIPHDLTENLMSWGSLDPTNMLEQNRPSIGVSPEVHNTEINLDCSVGTLVNIEHCDQGTLPDVEKMVNKAFEKHMQNLNNSIKKFVR